MRSSIPSCGGGAAHMLPETPAESFTRIDPTDKQKCVPCIWMRWTVMKSQHNACIYHLCSWVVYGQQPTTDVINSSPTFLQENASWDVFVSWIEANKAHSFYIPFRITQFCFPLRISRHPPWLPGANVAINHNEKTSATFPEFTFSVSRIYDVSGLPEDV